MSTRVSVCAGLAAQGGFRDRVLGGCQSTARELAELPEPIVGGGYEITLAVIGVHDAIRMVQLAEGAVDQILAIQPIAVAVVTVLEAVGVGRVIDPPLLHDAAEAVQALVNVIAIAPGDALMVPTAAPILRSRASGNAGQR